MRPPAGTKRGARGRAPNHNDSTVRRHICAEAARIMVEEGVRDFQQAKRKAIHRLNLPSDKNLPGNEEIEAAAAEYLRLFHSDRLETDLQRLRRLAIEAMDFLATFEPRLVGPVLSGMVTAESPVQLHITADTPEVVHFWLQEQAVPFEQGEKRMRFGGERQENVPLFRFTADNTIVELCVFSRKNIRETPLSPVDGKPMKRASRREVELLTTPTGGGTTVSGNYGRRP